MPVSILQELFEAAVGVGHGLGLGLGELHIRTDATGDIRDLEEPLRGLFVLLGEVTAQGEFVFVVFAEGSEKDKFTDKPFTKNGAREDIDKDIVGTPFLSLPLPLKKLFLLPVTVSGVLGRLGYAFINSLNCTDKI